MERKHDQFHGMAPTNAQQGILLNIIVGARWLPHLPSTGQNDFSTPAFVVSSVGAVALLGIVNVFRRGRLR